LSLLKAERKQVLRDEALALSYSKSAIGCWITAIELKFGRLTQLKLSNKISNIFYELNF